MKRNIALFLSAAMLMGLLTACGDKENNDPSTEPVKIVVTDNGWDSQKVHNEIARLVVEHAYTGYTFETSTASSSMNWLALIKGDVDLDIESWTDNVASYPDDVARGDIVDVGVLVPDSAQGLYVPRYVVEGDPERNIAPMAPDLKTVEDLKKYADVFPDDEDPTMGRIYGCLPGWMSDEILFRKYEYYGLDEMYTYNRLGSEGVLFASLASAYNKGEPWVGYCYEPTVIAGQLDLILLDDAPFDPDLYMDGKCAFPSQELKIVSGKYFAEKAPELLSFFQNYQTGSEPISAALAHIDATGATHAEAAVWFLREYDALIDNWLPAENAKALRDYLATLD